VSSAISPILIAIAPIAISLVHAAKPNGVDAKPKLALVGVAVAPAAHARFVKYEWEAGRVLCDERWNVSAWVLIPEDRGKRT
jgi:hypothetical protein